MIILAIDPGSALTGFALYNATTKRLLERGKLENNHLVSQLCAQTFDVATHLAVEHAQSFGAKVWNQVFDATLWAGRFVQAWDESSNSCPHRLVFRRDVKLHVTGSPRGDDKQVRQCLLERWGGRDAAIGTKANPGPLHGVTADAWAALAIAVYAAEVPALIAAEAKAPRAAQTRKRSTSAKLEALDATPTPRVQP